MGLLTDPSGLRGRPFQVLVKNQGKISLFLYFLAISWYILLAHEQVNSGTYLSENALLPGLVTVGCDVSKASSLFEELQTEKSLREGMPSAWIKAKMAHAGIVAYDHNFTLNYPLGKGAKFVGKNVYGIIHGGGASTESIVLSMPYRGEESVHPQTDASLALLLAVGACFRKQKYWAKDVILLVTEHEQLGMQAWLQAYHGTTCGAQGILESGEVWGRGGAIQAAINLELHGTRSNGLDVKIAGLNGQLPNLDLANLVHRICSKERVPDTLAGRDKLVEPANTTDRWLYSLDTLTLMVLGQASGVPDGNHGLFHRFGIEAVTLEAREVSGGGSVSLHHVGRVIEGIFRSVNNLLERFHQSYFFYLLVDTDRFVSIGLYMPCVGLLVATLFIKAFALYLDLKSLLQSDDDAASHRMRVNGVGVGTAVVYCYSVGVAVHNWGGSITRLSPLDTDDSLAIGYLIVALVSAWIPGFLLSADSGEWILLHIAALVHLAALVSAVAMHNFPLAFVVSVFVVPIALSVRTAENGWIRKSALICAHPLALLAFSVALSASKQFTAEQLPYRTWMGTKQALVLSLIDSLVYSSWNHPVAVLLYLPNWSMFWILAQAKRTSLDANTRNKTD